MRKKARLRALAALLFSALTAIILSGGALAVRAPTTLVIDAGHGGLDGGAVAADGTAESGLNLAIAQRLQLLSLLCGVPVTMTRESETLSYPESESTVRAKKVWDQKRRAELINAVENAVLISIHQNKYPDARPSGTQVLYGAAEGSELLGTLTHENLISALCPGNRRVAAPVSKTIYLMKHISCPAILVECGFLSNREESQRLKEPGYQTKLALVLAASYLQFQMRYL